MPIKIKSISYTQNIKIIFKSIVNYNLIRWLRETKIN